MDDNTIRSYGEQALRDEAQAILDQNALLDDNFEKAVDMMYHCQGKIIVTGVGKSGHVGAKIAATLASTGTPAFYINPLDVYHGDLGVMTDKDVVLALSNSGQTDELLRFIPMVLHMNVPIISITGNPNSLLAKYSNHHITVKVKKEACPLNLAPTSSTTAALAMGDALAIALMQVRHFKPRDFAQFHPGGELGKRLLTTAEDVMRSEDTMGNAKRVGAVFKQAVTDLMPAHPCIGDVRGAGLYIGCEIVKPGTKDPDQAAALDILETLRAHHVLTSVCGRFGNILKLRPPLVFSEQDVDWFMSAFTDTLQELGL